MKLKFLAILATLTAFTINAQEVEQIIGYISTPNDDARLYMRFDKLSDTECQFASPRNIKLINADSENPTLLDLVMDTPEQERFENNIIVSGPLYIFNNNGFPTTIKTDEGDEYKVVGIGDFAFARAALENMTITIPDNYKIGKGAFFQSQIGGVNLNNTTSIPDYCFYNIPFSTINFKDVVTIGKYAFAQSPLSPTNFGKVTTIEDYAFGGCTEIYSLEISDNIETLGKGVFFKCTNMRSLKIGNNLTSIGESAFENCTSLGADNGLEIPKNVKTIEKSAFKNCNSMKSLAFNEGLETIGESAFLGCSLSGSTLEIPSSVKSIGDYAFRGSSLISLILNEGLETIGAYAFAECGINTKETNDGQKRPYLRIPDTVTSIGDYAFYSCSNVDHLVMGKNVEKIGNYAFYLVAERALSHLDLPATLKEIGYMALYFTRTADTLDAISDIYSFSTFPPELPKEPGNPEDCYAFGINNEELNESKAFYGQDPYWMYPFLCLHVPIGSYDYYRSTPGWREFRCIIDDLLPQPTEETEPSDHTDVNDPLTYIIGYAYLKPGDDFDIHTDILKLDESSSNKLLWKKIVKGTSSTDEEDDPNIKESDKVIYEEDPIVTMTQDGQGHAERFGEKIVIAYRDGNTKLDSGGNEVIVDQTVAGAVILFVCPTITLVYDTKNETAQPGASQSLSRIRTLAEGDGTTEDETSPEVKEATEVAQLKEDNATYEHLVVYNSYPKLMLEPASGITISDIQRAKIDQDNNYTADGALADIDKEEQLQNDGLVENAQYIVPINPVQENRVITFSGISNDDQLTTEVVDEVIQLTPEIKVVVNGLTISIEGAQPESVVTVTNTNGQVVYNAKGKTFTMTTKGVYIVRVEDVTFKALVK